MAEEETSRVGNSSLTLATAPVQLALNGMGSYKLTATFDNKQTVSTIGGFRLERATQVVLLGMLRLAIMRYSFSTYGKTPLLARQVPPIPGCRTGKRTAQRRTEFSLCGNPQLCHLRQPS